MESSLLKNLPPIYKGLILALLIFCLGIATGGLYRQVSQTPAELRRAESFISAHHQKFPKTASDVDSIQTWMTFDYMNRIFILPPNYLKTKLEITDTRYPRLTLQRFLKENQTGKTVASLSEIQNAVRDYFTQKQQKP